MASLSSDDIASPRNAVVITDDTVGQYIIFTIDQQEYGVTVMAVREIRGWIPENKLPNLPPHVRGVINLRGVVIPILDLRARFGGGDTEATPTHVVVVLEVGDTLKGLLVDAISDILAIPRDQIKPAPAIDGDGRRSAFVKSLYTPEGRIIALLDVAEVCSAGGEESPQPPNHDPALAPPKAGGR